MLSKYLNVSTEAISHQNDDFFNNLANAVREYHEHGKAKQLKEDLSKIIKVRTNINTKFRLAHGMNAYVFVPMLKSDHVLYSDDTPCVPKKFAAKLRKKFAGKTASVDTKKVWVDGFFADKSWSFKICLEGIYQKSADCTPEEVAAVILHELGHAFTYMEFITDVVVRNVTLAAVMDEVFNKENDDIRVELISEVVKEAGYKNVNPAELSDANDGAVAYAVVAKAELQMSPRSGNNSVAYDKANWEAAADQFATRFGAGAPLASFLGKLYRQGQKLELTFKLINTAIDVGLSVVVPGYMAVWGIVHLTIFVIAGLLVDPTKMTYDHEGHRLTRIRQEMTGYLKSGKLESEDVQPILKELDKIEEMEKSYPRPVTMFDFVWRNIVNNYSRGYKQKVLQKDLEELANNRAFAAAAVLKTV